MKEQLLALEKKMHDDIYKFAEENETKSVEEILAMLGIKEYTLEENIYSFTAPEIDTNELIYMTYDRTWLNVHLIKDGKPFSVDSAYYSPTGKELMIEILYATTYHKDLIRAMMVAIDRATE